MASILVESMKRLYQSCKITKENVSARVKSGKITEDEYWYITGEAYEEQKKFFSTLCFAQQVVIEPEWVLNSYVI